MNACHVLETLNSGRAEKKPFNVCLLFFVVALISAKQSNISKSADKFFSTVFTLMTASSTGLEKIVKKKKAGRVVGRPLDSFETF